MATAILIYFLSTLFIINCIPMFDYYDQAYDQFQYDEENSVDSNNTNLFDTNETETGNDSQKHIEKYSIEYSNGTAKDLYLIRTIIYEIGILADADKTKNSSVTSETQDQVDISLFHPTKNELIDESKIPKQIKEQVDELTSSALTSLDIVPLIDISTKNKGSTEIRLLSLFPNSFVRLTANISTVRSSDDILNRDKKSSQFVQEKSTVISKNVETRTTAVENATEHLV